MLVIAMIQRRPCLREELLEFSYDADRGVIELRRGMTQPWH
jgi:hypothetical protein